MTDDLWVQRRVHELSVAFTFLTRLPVNHAAPIGKGELSCALWCAPLVGIAVGLTGAAVYWLAQALNVPPLAAATLAVAAIVLVTGALHEDGLADVADGFGGGGTRERKLEIMRDSRIGTYGVCALVLSYVLRVAALASLGNADLVATALVAAHAGARAPIAAFMSLVPLARTDGLSADAGNPPPSSAAVAALLGFVALVFGLGFGAGVVAAILLCAGFGLMAWLCNRQIGGQTGDVLGALEQIGEIAILLVAAAALRPI
jgi:adenosylcobinamide-GDP ribazoletransferase